MLAKQYPPVCKYGLAYSTPADVVGWIYLVEVMLIRGFEPAIVFEKIRKLDFADGSEKTKQFAFFGNGRTISFDASDLPGRVKSRSILRCCSILGIECRLLALPNGVFDIRVKNNIRLNYRTGAGDMRSIKIALPSVFRPGNLAREISARKILRRINAKLPIPEMIRYDRTDLEWFEEQYIDQKLSTKYSKIQKFLRFHANDFYRPFARSRPIEQMLRIWSIDQSDIQRIFEESGSSEVVDISKTWPVALIHGDLSPGNMITDNKYRLFLVDLEKTGRGPIAWDLRKMYLSQPKLVIKALNSMSCASDLRPQIQMKVAFSVQLIDARRNEASFNEYNSRHLSRSKSEIAKDKAKKEQILLSIIGSDA